MTQQHRSGTAVDVSAAADDLPGVSRRHFLAGAAVIGAGLVLGVELGKRLPGGAVREPSGAAFSPNAFVRIAPDDTITVTIGQSEMGQGVSTSLPTILAEELDVDPTRIRVDFGTGEAFFDPMMHAQFTGGSASVLANYDRLRKAGATARQLLLLAAAKEWGVAAGSLSTADGVVTDGTQRLSYGALATAAATLYADMKRSGAPAIPITLKDPKNFRWIGKPLHRFDSAAKVSGAATFGLDVQRPDMLIAMLARPPVFGATPRSIDDSAARAIAGVVQVKTVPSGIAVLAENTWAARRGRDALKIEWDLGAMARFDSNEQFAEYRRLAALPGKVAKNVGDVDAALANAARTLDVTYELPYLAHAAMEPLNCVAEFGGGGCDLWVGTQQQSSDQQCVARALGMPPESVRIHTQLLGGGFGRRSTVDGHVAVEAALVARGVGRPVKVMWTREDDMHGGYYRPATVVRLRGAVDDAGRVTAWQQHAVTQSLLAGTEYAEFGIKDGVDSSSVEGAVDMPYAVANHRVEVHHPELPIPVLWWRSVGHSHHGFVVNGFIDELAALGGRDPLDLRRELLAASPKHLAILNLVAEKSGWGSPLPLGRGRGIALHESFGTIVAEVAEASVESGRVRVHRVVCAVDCGQQINPLTIEAQMQSAIVFGLSAALDGEITFADGRVQQSNFDTYRPLRMDEMPQVEVHLAPSGGKMGGIGEPGLPPLAAAVAGAVFAATGQRVRTLPMSKALQG